VLGSPGCWKPFDLLILWAAVAWGRNAAGSSDPSCLFCYSDARLRPPSIVQQFLHRVEEPARPTWLAPRRAASDWRGNGTACRLRHVSRESVLACAPFIPCGAATPRSHRPMGDMRQLRSRRNPRAPPSALRRRRLLRADGPVHQIRWQTKGSRHLNLQAPALRQSLHAPGQERDLRTRGVPVHFHG